MSYKTGLRGLFVILIIVCALASWHFRDAINVAQIETLVAQSGSLAAVLFVLLYALISLALIPVTIFTIAAGALFGPFYGYLLALAGAALGATIAFSVSRYLFSDWVKARNWPWLNKLIAGVEQQGWQFVALVRLVPIVPFSASNYAFGLAAIPLSHFLLASLISMSPAALAYCWLGHAGKQAIADESSANWIQLGIVIIALLAIIILVPRMVRKFRKLSV